MQSGDEVVQAAATIPTLRALSMSYCTSVTDASITALAAQKPGLQELRLDWCSKVCGCGVLRKCYVVLCDSNPGQPTAKFAKRQCV
jgi:hypothetical protein